MHTDPIAVFTTPFGAFAVDTKRDNKMSRILARGELPHEDLVGLVKHLVTKDSVALDIGAHIGTFTVPLAAYAGRVIAFEPAPESYALLARNAVNCGSTLEIRNKGLAAAPGRARILSRVATNAGAHTLVPGDEIEISTLDAEAANADFIKIDVEGMEAHVLMGGMRLIESSRPAVLFEVNLSQLRAHGTSARVLERFFTSRGYTLYLPLFGSGGQVLLAKVGSLTLLSALIAPRAWFLHSGSAPFDVLALPDGVPASLYTAGFGAAARFALKENIRIKLERLRKYFIRL